MRPPLFRARIARQQAVIRPATLNENESQETHRVEPQKSFYVADFLEKRAMLTPHRPALHDTATGRDLTYGEWNARANQAANFLRALGVGAGDRVCVYACNSLDYLDVWQACGKIGAILQNVNWRLTAERTGAAHPRRRAEGAVLLRRFRRRRSTHCGPTAERRAFRGLRRARTARLICPFRSAIRCAETLDEPARPAPRRAVGDLLHGRHDRPAQRRDPDATAT